MEIKMSILHIKSTETSNIKIKTCKKINIKLENLIILNNNIFICSNNPKSQQFFNWI